MNIQKQNTLKVIFKCSVTKIKTTVAIATHFRVFIHILAKIIPVYIIVIIIITRSVLASLAHSFMGCCMHVATIWKLTFSG